MALIHGRYLINDVEEAGSTTTNPWDEDMVSWFMMSTLLCCVYLGSTIHTTEPGTTNPSPSYTTIATITNCIRLEDEESSNGGKRNTALQNDEEDDGERW